MFCIMLIILIIIIHVYNCRIQIKFELYGEKKDREIGKIDQFCIRAEDVSLQDILLTFLSDYVRIDVVFSIDY